MLQGRHVIQQPAHLAGTIVRIRVEAGDLAQRFTPASDDLLQPGSMAGILPAEYRRKRCAAGPVPCQQAGTLHDEGN